MADETIDLSAEITVGMNGPDVLTPMMLGQSPYVLVSMRKPDDESALGIHIETGGGVTQDAKSIAEMLTYLAEAFASGEIIMQTTLDG